MPMIMRFSPNDSPKTLVFSYVNMLWKCIAYSETIFYC